MTCCAPSTKLFLEGEGLKGFSIGLYEGEQVAPGASRACAFGAAHSGEPLAHRAMALLILKLRFRRWGSHLN